MPLRLIRFAVATLAILLLAPAMALAQNPYVVADVASGAVLAHNKAFKRWYPASVTKVMTARLAFKAVRSGDLSMKSPVRMTKRAAKEPPSKMGYPVGTVLTLDNALKIILVKSANDVAMAIGEAVAGSEMEFVAMMNEEARALGMSDTRFANPNGLPDGKQYTTARDLALLAVATRRDFPEFAGFFALEGIEAGGKLIPNYNILLGRFAGADGMKTGYVCASGFNLAASATRGGRTIVAVVLGALTQEDRADLAADLLAQGFATDPAGKPTLANLQPYGEDRERVADIRGSICTQKAQQARYDGRDFDGKLVYRSSHLGPMNREPVAVAVAPGGATGPAAANTVFADVPVPTPRPGDAPAMAFARQGSAPGEAEEPARPAVTSQLRGVPAPGIPVPTPRPSI